MIPDFNDTVLLLESLQDSASSGGSEVHSNRWLSDLKFRKTSKILQEEYDSSEHNSRVNLNSKVTQNMFSYWIGNHSGGLSMAAFLRFYTHQQLEHFFGVCVDLDELPIQSRNLEDKNKRKMFSHVLSPQRDRH